MTSIAALFCLLAQAEWIDRLGDDDPAVRDAASVALHQMGSRAEAQLERALLHPSLEVRGRAADLLDRLPEYVLRTLPRRQEHAEFRRRWNAVIDATIWKRPIPKELWDEICGDEGELVELNGCIQERPHSPLEILHELNAQAAVMLRHLIDRVGLDAQVEVSRRRERGEAHEAAYRYLLPLLLKAEPDSECFEEIYGTIALLEQEHHSPFGEDWSREDRATAIRLLVDLRRRPGAPPLVPPKTREEALDLARRGPIVRGIADALGRSFANRGRGFQKMQQELEKVERDGDFFAHQELRLMYDRLFCLDREIGRHFYNPDLLGPAKAALPARHAPVPEKHEPLFEKICAVPATDGALRVVREILDAGVELPATDDTAGLLREIGRRVDHAAGVP